MDWRLWLKDNHASASEIWLIYPRKHSGSPRIPYNHAVEEALCFGWIDSITKGIDEDRYSQRFTPRKAASTYSQTNKERLKRLIAQKKVIPSVLESVSRIATEQYKFPPDILDVLRENKRAWTNFQRYSEAYKHIRIAFIDTARKRPSEFEKRLKHFMRKTELDKQYGFGIEEYY